VKIVLFKKNNFEGASMEINRVAKAILKGTEGIKSIGSIAAKETVDYLNKLAIQVKKKEIKSLDMLSDAFQVAEYNTAHDCFQVTNIYVSNDNLESFIGSGLNTCINNPNKSGCFCCIK
jgi:hypothetical protein